MSLPSIERTPAVRLTGAELASSGANRVVPVAPVNPPVPAQSAAPAKPTPGVVNLVNPALQGENRQRTEGEPVYTSVPDPVKPNAETVPRDWTIHRPAPQKVEDPPPKPMSQVLMDHLKTMWTASASAIQIEQVKNQVAPDKTQVPAAQVQGNLVKEVLTYQPTKIKKTENI